MQGGQQRVCPGLSAGSAAQRGTIVGPRGGPRISAGFHPWACLSGLNEAADLVSPHMCACFLAPRGWQPEGLMKRSLIAHDSGGWHLSAARWLWAALFLRSQNNRRMLDLLLKAVQLYSLKTIPLKALEGPTLRGLAPRFWVCLCRSPVGSTEGGAPRVWGASRRRGAARLGGFTEVGCRVSGGLDGGGAPRVCGASRRRGAACVGSSCRRGAA